MDIPVVFPNKGEGASIRKGRSGGVFVVAVPPALLLIVFPRRNTGPDDLDPTTFGNRTKERKRQRNGSVGAHTPSGNTAPFRSRPCAPFPAPTDESFLSGFFVA